MTSLLVSVQNIREATSAKAGGADIIDFKNPALGALAATDPEIWEAAVDAKFQSELSAALGEFAAWDAPIESRRGRNYDAVRMSACVPASFRYAKMGNRGLASAAQLTKAWQALLLPDSVELVAVAYADFHAAESMPIDQVCRVAIDAGLKTWLVDTMTKDGRTLTDFVDIDCLTASLRIAKRGGLRTLLAGSMTRREARRLWISGVRPDGWGVRGDVCKDSGTPPGPDDVGIRRQHPVCQQRVAMWREFTSKGQTT